MARIRAALARAMTASGSAVVARSMSPAGRPSSAFRTAPPTMRASSPSRFEQAEHARHPRVAEKRRRVEAAVSG